MTESRNAYVNELKDHVGQEVTLHGWLYNSRASGKAPLNPPEFLRHERMEKIRALVNEAREKKSWL